MIQDFFRAGKPLPPKRREQILYSFVKRLYNLIYFLACNNHAKLVCCIGTFKFQIISSTKKIVDWKIVKLITQYYVICFTICNSLHSFIRLIRNTRISKFGMQDSGISFYAKIHSCQI